MKLADDFMKIMVLQNEGPNKNDSLAFPVKQVSGKK